MAANACFYIHVNCDTKPGAPAAAPDALRIAPPAVVVGHAAPAASSVPEPRGASVSLVEFCTEATLSAIVGSECAGTALRRACS